MTKDAIPFWENNYREKDIVAFSSEPNATVTEFEHLVSTPAAILEAGCGEGQNALYLAQKGHCVDAFDLSEYAIEKLKHRSDLLHAPVNASAADLTAYSFEKRYDVIPCFGTLHFVEREDWKRFLLRAKENTRTGGIHIMQIFTDTVPASADIAPFAVGLAKEGELRELYDDWEVLQFRSYVFEDEHLNVPKHLHASNKIVARRTKRRMFSAHP